MAWIVGLATDQEIAALRARDWTVEEPCEAVREALASLEMEGDAGMDGLQTVNGPGCDGQASYQCPFTGEWTNIRAVQVYVDTDLFEVMSGPDWPIAPDLCRTAKQLADHLQRIAYAKRQQASQPRRTDGTVQP